MILQIHDELILVKILKKIKMKIFIEIFFIIDLNRYKFKLYYCTKKFIEFKFLYLFLKILIFRRGQKKRLKKLFKE
jgi:hypothetical protein